MKHSKGTQALETSVQVPTLPAKATDSDVEEAFQRWEQTIKRSLLTTDELRNTLEVVLSERAYSIKEELAYAIAALEAVADDDSFDNLDELSKTFVKKALANDRLRRPTSELKAKRTSTGDADDRAPIASDGHYKDKK